MSGFILLKDLEVYQLAMRLSALGWEIYIKMTWQDKKTMGDQFIESLDSVGANIAEGYLRFHYLDKIKFYYISRASLSESCDHWLELMYKRNKVDKVKYNKIKETQNKLSIKLQNFIKTTYNSKNNNKFL
ncbi:four helix bundle protein [Candidatus Falkowbacteria bacterium]|nr:four helix bundle protein [Candidatus Falkowbacteria bacterium]